MIRVASRLAFACCLLVQGPALANSADTDWLLEEIRNELQSLTKMEALGDCLDSTQCLSLADDLVSRDLLSAQPYPARFTAKQFPTQEQPWFIDGHGDNRDTRSSVDRRSAWCDYTYRRTSLIQTVESLERVSLATFWERNGVELFAAEQNEPVGLPRPPEPLLKSSKRQGKRISVHPPAFAN